MSPQDFVPGPLADVEVVQADGDRWTLVFVREIRHPREKVWAALTDPNQLAQWSPYTADRDLARTGPATLVMIDGDEPQKFSSSVTVADPPSRLEHTWGQDRLQWQLDRSDGGTRLTLRHTVEDRDWIPKYAAGWHICLVVAERLLDGDPIGPIVGEAAMDAGWPDLKDTYAAKLMIPSALPQ